MITKLAIQNFKGIGSCNIEDLARINLLIGKNDSGKSTIMEAAYYLFRELYLPGQLSSVMRRRTDVFSGGSELWFRYRTGTEISISTFFDSIKLTWQIRLVKQTDTILSTPYYEDEDMPEEARLTPLGGTQYRGSDFSLSTTSGGNMIGRLPVTDELKNKTATYASNVTLIDCTLKSKTSEIEGTLSELKISGKDLEFGEILNDIYGKGKEWEFMPQLENPSEKRLAFKEDGQLKYFSDFGDGLRCCVGILGTAVTLNDTAIFIEEIESHQHSGSLSKMIRHLVNIARVNNLQVFLSTHSMDVWESLHRGVYAEEIEKEKEEFRCFLIDRDVNTGTVTAEETDDVQKITNALR